jgi:uncharacterized membrane protein YkvI
MRVAVFFLLAVVVVSLVIGGMIGAREDEVISGLGSGLIIGATLVVVLGSILYLVARHDEKN